MFAAIRGFVSLQEAYVHPSDEGYIGADENWEYLNRYIQPCYAPTYSEASTEACSWTPIYPTAASDFHWAGIRSNVPDGPMLN